MKTKRFTLLMAGMLCASASFATDYFVSVEGAGLKDGSSWENAIDFATMYGKINDYENGDVFYFQGGTYVPTEVTTITKGYSFIGGFAKNLEGTEHEVTYPSETPTIFSAAGKNGLVAFGGDFDKDPFISTPIVIKGIDFTQVVIPAGNTNKSALHLGKCNDVKVENCNFYDNVSNEVKTVTDSGGPASLCISSNVVFKECQFYNNSANGRGGAVKLKGVQNKTGETTFERCLFKGNKVAYMGSAIFMNHGQQLTIVNSLIENNESTDATGELGAIFVVTPGNYENKLRIVNSTIVNNRGGAQVLGRNGSDIVVANSIIVGDDETSAIKIAQKEGPVSDPKSGQSLSLGYNIIGKYVGKTPSAPAWKTSDWVSEDNVLSSIFGSNNVQEGPIASPYGATMTQLSEILADWNVTQDLTVDMNGTSRDEVSVPGAVVAEPIKGKFTITDAKYATYYNDLGYIMPLEVKGGVVTDTKSDGTLAVNYQYVPGSVVPAKSALLLSGAVKDYKVPLKLEENSEDTNLLRGTGEEAETTLESTDAKFYKLANGFKGIGFYWASENGAAFINSANRAYLVVENEVNAAKSFVFEGSATGIRNIEVASSHPKVYNLQGMEMTGSAHLAKGVYIINGKKVIIK